MARKYHLPAVPHRSITLISNKEVFMSEKLKPVFKRKKIKV